MVFMAKDAGALAPPIMWPEGWDRALTIELADPVDGGRAWVFLLHFADPPAPSSIDYVRYDDDRTTIHARNYRMSFHPDAPIGIGDLALLPAGGGDGRDMADRLKIRFRSGTVLRIRINRNEEQFTSRTIAWIDGPVRVIRRTSNRMILFWRIPTPSAELDNVYYANIFEFPTRVDLPFDADAFLRDPEFRVSTDLYREACGRFVFRNEHNPDGVLVDGVMSEAEQNLDRSTYRWSCMHGVAPGRTGGWLNRLLYSTIDAPVHPTLYYNDDAASDDGPEDEPGEFGDVGYCLEGIEHIKRGRFELLSVMYSFPEYSPEAVERILLVLDRPLVIEVGPLQVPGTPPEGRPVP